MIYIIDLCHTFTCYFSSTHGYKNEETTCLGTRTKHYVKRVLEESNKILIFLPIASACQLVSSQNCNNVYIPLRSHWILVYDEGCSKKCSSPSQPKKEKSVEVHMALYVHFFGSALSSCSLLLPCCANFWNYLGA